MQDMPSENEVTFQRPGGKLSGPCATVPDPLWRSRMPSDSGTAEADEQTLSPPGTDAVLAAEREHLNRSREFLRLMRENVLGLRAMAADPVSEEYLKADLHRRAE